MTAAPPAREQSSHAQGRKFRRLSSEMIALGLTVAALCLVNVQISSGASSYDPAADGYSLANLTASTGAQAWWDAGFTGQGIDVALIDTGVTPVPALSIPGKIVYGPDFSLDSRTPGLRDLDGYGHGTFMAGLIAGHDPTLTAPYSAAPASAYRGMAPDARIVSIKVGTFDGGADVSQVIAAIDWVVQHAHDPGFNMRVLNLSYGTSSSQSYAIDPLAYAAEQAWKHGIVVVAAAGNTGYQRGHGAPGLADPAYDPYVIGVGGYDTNGTAALEDDSMGSYSASAGCSKCKNPDFVAPGSHLQGLRVPGSYLDLRHGDGALDASYLRGSGTSEATAITSGVVALLLQKYPDLTPDEVKSFIEDNAQKLPHAHDQAQGNGEIDLAGMVAKTPKGVAPLADTTAGQPSRQNYEDSTGTGSLEASRGADHQLALNGKTEAGGIDVFGDSFDASAPAAAGSAGDVWSSGAWNGNSWSGNSWSGKSWSGNSWSGNSWSGNSWSGNAWTTGSWA